MDFNPRSREGSDTTDGDDFHTQIIISIHAPARGATLEHGRRTAEQSNFNPRSREGSDNQLEW